MSTTAVDPRIRARRISVARDAGRRRLRRLVVVVAVVAVASAGLALTWTPLLDVEVLEVQGAERTPVEAVAEAADLEPGDPLVWLDPEDVEQAVLALPWVDDAVVRRAWSGTVTIEITERVPAAALARTEGGWLVADGDGRVLAVVDEAPPDLPVADGLSVSGRPGDTVAETALGPLEVAAAMPPALRAMAATVQGAGADLEVALRDGGVIVLGGSDDAGTKLAAASAVLATVAPGCVERLDVGLPAAPALVRVPACA
jgi:cell division protein FtsQ